MSNFLAVATITAALKSLLGEALAGAVDNAAVTTLRPDALANGAVDRRGINVYLYQATPNGARRNDDLATRRGDGGLVVRPRAAVDLSYLLSFYGDATTLEPERLLAIAVRTLNERPALPRGLIQRVVDNPPPELSFLQFSDLADQPDTVRVSPVSMNLEELSKLWSVFFQTPYMLSLAYQAGVVLIESELETPQPALPVRDRTLHIAPFRNPRVEGVVGENGPGTPITSGSTIVLRGRRLLAELTRVRIGGVVVTPGADGLSDGRVVVEVPATVAAGVQGVQVLHPLLLGTPPVEHRGVESNVAPFVLRPTVTAVQPGPGTGELTVTVVPDIAPKQQVTLLLNELNAPAGQQPDAYSLVAPPSSVTLPSVTFAANALPAGTYLVRVQVDGADSSLLPDSSGAFNTPSVSLP